MSVVRATAVRGHLRFWWRAVRGWRAGGSLERLWELESALFGSAGEGGASPLSVEVEVLREGEKVGIAQYGRAVQWYLGFPLRGDKEWAPVKEGVAFRLRLRFPEKVGELNFWEELGGRPLGLGDLRGDRGPDPEGLWRPPAPGGRGAGGGGDPREASPVWPKSRVARRGAPPHPKSFVRVVPLSWRELAERYQAFRQARPGGTPEARAAPTGPSPTGCGASRGGTPPTTCPGTPCTSSPGPTSACPSSSTSRTGATPPTPPSGSRRPTAGRAPSSSARLGKGRSPAWWRSSRGQVPWGKACFGGQRRPHLGRGPLAHPRGGPKDPGAGG